MAENTKLVCDSGTEEVDIQKMAVSDKEEGFLENTEASDSFVVDIESLSHNTADKDITANSRISVKLQRNLSRKGSQRGDKKKISNPASGVGGAANGLLNASVNGKCNPEKTTTVPSVALGTKEELINTEPHQLFTFTAQNRSRSFGKQRTGGWFMDPRRVLFLFASLSSMGTMLLIYFTLSIRKFSGDEPNQSQ